MFRIVRVLIFIVLSISIVPIKASEVCHEKASDSVNCHNEMSEHMSETDGGAEEQKHHCEMACCHMVLTLNKDFAFKLAEAEIQKLKYPVLNNLFLNNFHNSLFRPPIA